MEVRNSESLRSSRPPWPGIMVPESLNGVKRKVLPWMLRALPSLPLSVTRALKRKIAP